MFNKLTKIDDVTLNIRTINKKDNVNIELSFGDKYMKFYDHNTGENITPIEDDYDNINVMKRAILSLLLTLIESLYLSKVQ